MANEMEEIGFELPEELENIEVAQETTEEEVRDLALETLKSRTERHNEAVLAKAEAKEGSEKASFIKRKFVAAVINPRVIQPGTAYMDVVNGQPVKKATKGYSVACNWKYASGRVSKDIHFALSI